MKRVITAVILVPLILIAIFKAPPWLLATIVGVCALLAAWEFKTLAEGYGVRPFRWFTLVLLAIFFIPFETFAPQYRGYFTFGYSAMVILSAFALLALGMMRENVRDGLPAAAFSFIALPYIGIGLGATLVPIKSLPFGSLLLTYLLIVVWSGDIFAYYVGKNFGRHKMAPRISPGKSWEGAVASLVGAVAVGTLFLAKAPAVWAGITRIHLAESLSV